MKTFQYCFMLMATAVWVILLSAAPVRAADQEHEMEVGNEEEAMFSRARVVGNLTFAPGHYRVQHRMEGADHFVRFTFLKGVHESFEMGGRPKATEIVGEIKCRVEPLDARATKTVIYSRTESGGERLTKVHIRGENVAHVF